jgi:hypothetical protein
MLTLYIAGSGRRTAESIEFGGSLLVEVTDAAGATVLYSMEEPVVGEWARWTDNAGEFTDPSAPELLRFSEWTHSYSGGYVMVADLQGARHAGGWRLADPAVLCSDVGRFGPCDFDAVQVPRCLAAVRHALHAGEAAEMAPRARLASAPGEPTRGSTSAAVPSECHIA